MHSKIMFVVIVLAAACSAHIGGQVPDQELSQSYCGRNLAMALAAICGNMPMKRFDGMYQGAIQPYYKEQEHSEWPWMVPYKARGLSTQRGKRQFVVSECCDKPCSISELITYC